MTSYLLDTHTWVWDLTSRPHLSPEIVMRIDASDNTFVSVISIYEVTQKVRLNKWPAMAPFADRLPELVLQQGYGCLQLSAEASQMAGLMDWDHRDPFDRMIAATSILNKLPLISADTTFDALSARPDWPGRIW